MKKYSHYVDSGVTWIGQVPADWRIGKAKLALYRSKEKAKNDDPTILSLTSKGVVVRNISNNDGQIAESYYDYNPVSVGDLLLNPMDLVTNAFAFVSKFEGVISPAYFNLKARTGYHNEYFKYYFQLQYWNSSFFHHGKGVSMEHRWTLNEEAFRNFPIPIPTQDEQIIIASFLDKKVAEIDSLINDKKSLLLLYDQHKIAIIDEVITNGIEQDVELRESGIEWFGKVPGHWKINKLKYLGYCQNGINIGAEAFGSGSPFISYSDVYKNRAIDPGINGLVNCSDADKKNYSVVRGDVLFTRTSETVEEIGIASTCLQTVPEGVFAGFLIRFRPTDDRLAPEFSKYFFRAQLHRRFFVKEMNLVTRASLSQELLKKLPVLIPPIEEQIQIAAHLDNELEKIDKKIKKTLKLIDLLKEYRTSLIFEAVTGKININEVL